MAERDLNNSSVVFKNKNSSSPADKNEADIVYAEVTEETEQSNGKTVSTDKKGNSRCRRLTCCLEILCVILLLSYLAVFVYVVINHMSEQNQLKENQESLEELKGQNQELRGQNQELKGQNEELKGQNNNLTRKVQDLQANWDELNVSRAQWSVDAYCFKNNRQCKPCQKGWEHSQSSCYVKNNAEPDEQKSWGGAREDCRGKISNLVVIASQEEKKVVNDISWPREGIKGYWIGLRVKDMKWQWDNGSDLTETSWIDPPTDGRCAILVYNQGLKSVNCRDRNAWICEKRSLVL